MNVALRASLSLIAVHASLLGALFALAPAAPRASVSREPKVEDETQVRLTYSPWREGDRIDSKRKLVRKLEYETSIGGESVDTQEQEDREEVERRVEILGVEEGRPTKIRVHYQEWSETVAGEAEEEDEGPEEARVDLRGRTVVLEEKDGEVEITDKDGKPLDEDVEERVRSLETDDGKRISRGNDALAEWLASAPRKTGARLEVPGEVANEAFGEDTVEHVEMHLELREVRDVEGTRCAVFGASLSLKTKQDDFEVAFELEGEITWTVEGLRNVRSEWKGPVEVSSEVAEEDVKVEISGTGTIEVEEDRSYSRAD